MLHPIQIPLKVPFIKFRFLLRFMTPIVGNFPHSLREMFNEKVDYQPLSSPDVTFCKINLTSVQLNILTHSNLTR